MRAIAAGWLLLVSGCAGLVTAPATFIPAYAPRTGELTVPGCTSVRSVVAVDGRARTSLVGERFSRYAPEERYPIFMSGDAAEWLHDGADQYLSDAHVYRGPEGPVDVRIVLRSIEVQENAARLADFSARVVLEVQVFDADTGGRVSRRTFTGTFTEAGWVGEGAAYRAALNGALEVALRSMLTDDSLEHAFCGQPMAVARAD